MLVSSAGETTVAPVGPVPDPLVEDRRERIILTGDLPSPSNPPTGCRFHTRCPWRQETKCDTERPVLRIPEIPGIATSHRVACHWTAQIESGEIQSHEVKAQLVVQHYLEALARVTA